MARIVYNLWRSRAEETSLTLLRAESVPGLPVIPALLRPWYQYCHRLHLGLQGIVTAKKSTFPQRGKYVEMMKIS